MWERTYAYVTLFINCYGKLPGLVQPSTYYLLLLDQVGTNEVKRRSLRTIRRDFRATGQLVQGAGSSGGVFLDPFSSRENY